LWAVHSKQAGSDRIMHAATTADEFLSPYRNVMHSKPSRNVSAGNLCHCHLPCLPAHLVCVTVLPHTLQNLNQGLSLSKLCCIYEIPKKYGKSYPKKNDHDN
jgi:hypothetical protein